MSVAYDADLAPPDVAGFLRLAKDVAVATRMSELAAADLVGRDLKRDLQEQLVKLETTLWLAKHELQQLRLVESPTKAKARDHLYYLRGNSPEVAFRCPNDGTTFCVHCARKVWLHDTKAILVEDTTSMAATELVRGESWDCDGCDNRWRES